MILRVGLTGGIASGKSTVRHLLHDRGAYTIDADKLVAQLYEPDAAGHTALVATYGTGILRDDRTIDRAKLANVAFSSPDEAKRLNALIHPIVVRRTEELLHEYEQTHADGIAVVEATLMIESGGRNRYDRIIVVDVDPETQIARGVARGLAREEVQRRVAHQLPREERLRYADYVIDNSAGRDALERETHRVYAHLLADLDEKKNPGA